MAQFVCRSLVESRPIVLITEVVQIGMTLWQQHERVDSVEAPERTLRVGVVIQHLNPKLPYNAERDFAPVSLVAVTPLVIAVHPSVPAQNMQELVALAKAKPGELNMASPGNTTGPHLAGELFQSVSGIKLQHVPYRGGPQSTTALIRGEAQVYFDTPTGIMPHVESGQVRALAQTATTRVPQLGNMPTMAEAGCKGCEFDVYNGIVVPAGVPVQIAARIEAAIKAVVTDAKVRQRFETDGFAVVALPGAAFASLLSKEVAKWQKVAEDRGISPP